MDTKLIQQLNDLINYVKSFEDTFLNDTSLSDDIFDSIQRRADAISSTAFGDKNIYKEHFNELSMHTSPSRNKVLQILEDMLYNIQLKTLKKSEEKEGVGDSMEELQELLNDLEILITTCKGDVGKDVRVSYEFYVDDYNNILSRLNELGYFESFKPIEVELEAQHLTPLPPFEQAKLREIILNSEKLVSRLQKIVNPEAKENKGVKYILELIFSRFHLVAQQLEIRYDSRDTIKITNEYDVQDLLHALLRIYFDDVRSEEWTPSYGTKSSRIDFLLKNESIAVEVKFARTDSDKKRITDELIIDIERYTIHPNVKTLYCFVYDHNKEILNPAEIEELSGKRNSTDVFVYVRPKLLDRP